MKSKKKLISFFCEKSIQVIYILIWGKTTHTRLDIILKQDEIARASKNLSKTREREEETFLLRLDWPVHSPRKRRESTRRIARRGRSWGAHSIIPLVRFQLAFISFSPKKIYIYFFFLSYFCIITLYS